MFKRTRFIFHPGETLWPTSAVPATDTWQLQLPESLLRTKMPTQPEESPEGIDRTESASVGGEAILSPVAGLAGMVNGHRFFKSAFIGLSPQDKGKRGKPFHAEIACDGRSRHLQSIGIAIGIGRYADEKVVMEMDGIDPRQLFFSSRAPLPWLLRLNPAPVTGRCGEVAITQARQIQIITDEAMSIMVDGKPVTRTPATFTFLPP